MGRKTIVREEGSPAGAWMNTFSDMNTLLLTFFVLLFSMSSLKSAGFQEFFRAFSGDQLGLMQEGSDISSGLMIVNPIPEVPPRPVRSAWGAMIREGEEQTGGSALPESVEFSFSDSPDGAVLVILANNILFAPGSVELSEEASSVLRYMRVFLAELFTMSDRRVTIEGHTDDSGPREENYLVSARRAMAVLEFLLEDGVLPPSRFAVVGYGSSRPRAPNNTAGNRARNRRVQIVMEPPEASIFQTEEE